MFRSFACLAAFAALVADVSAAKNEKTAEPRTLLSTRGKELFADDFNEPLGSRWKAAVGDWKVEDGVLTGAEREADKHGAVARHATPMQDVIIQFSFKLDGAKNISLSINDAKEHVCRMSVTPNGFSLRKDDHDHAGPDKAVVFETRAEKIVPGKWYTALVEMRGPDIVAQIGDFSPMVGSHELISTAKANFGVTVAGQSASFRDVHVWEALPNSAWPETKKRLESTPKQAAK